MTHHYGTTHHVVIDGMGGSLQIDGDLKTEGFVLPLIMDGFSVTIDGNKVDTYFGPGIDRAVYPCGCPVDESGDQVNAACPDRHSIYDGDDSLPLAGA